MTANIIAWQYGTRMSRSMEACLFLHTYRMLIFAKTTNPSQANRTAQHVESYYCNTVTLYMKLEFLSEQHTLYARNCTKAIQADVPFFCFFSARLNILHSHPYPRTDSSFHTCCTCPLDELLSMSLHISRTDFSHWSPWSSPDLCCQAVNEARGNPRGHVQVGPDRNPIKDLVSGEISVVKVKFKAQV